MEGWDGEEDSLSHTVGRYDSKIINAVSSSHNLGCLFFAATKGVYFRCGVGGRQLSIIPLQFTRITSTPQPPQPLKSCPVTQSPIPWY